MKLEKYSIVFSSSLERVSLFEENKKIIKDLNFVPACNTIENFDYYKKLAKSENYTSDAYFKLDETNKFLGKLGCNLSHQILLRGLCKKNYIDTDWILVLEDDCEVSKYYDEKLLHDIATTATNNNSHYVQLYTNPGFLSEQKSKDRISDWKKLYKMSKQWHTLSYMISLKGIKIIEKLYPMDENIDKFYSNNIDKLNSICYVNDMFLNSGEVPNTTPTKNEDGTEKWGRVEYKLGSVIWEAWKPDKVEEEKIRSRFNYIDNYLIISNYKCGFSSINKIKKREAKTSTQLNSDTNKIIFLYRIPSKRIISSFLNWCVRVPFLDKKYKKRSNIMELIKKQLGEQKYNTFYGNIKNGKIEIAFKTFLKNLHKIYEHDEHLHPQCKILESNNIVNVDKMICIDKDQDVKELEKILKTQIPHENKTINNADKDRCEKFLKNNDKYNNIIYNLYRSDYILFKNEDT